MGLRDALRLQAAFFLAALPPHLAWEVAQMALYEGAQPGLAAALGAHVVPTLGDGLMTLAVYWSGWLAFRDARWILRPGLGGRALMAAAGGALALGVEWHALYQMGAWAYRPGMPRVPLLGVGLLPVVQMALIPPLAAWAAARWWRWSVSGGAVEARAGSAA